jgi:putative peptide zinc metalloprotease protein
MSRPLLAEGWYRMRHLRPRVRSHVRFHRHAYRGEVWHVIEDRLGGKHQRFNPHAYRIIDLMDGARTMDDIWAVVTAELSDDTPTQNDVLQLLASLHAADLVQVDVTPDTAELLQRRSKQVRRKWFSRLGNPVGLRIPLFDPDRLLQAMLRLSGRRGAVIAMIWMVVVLPALLLLPAHWHALSATTRDQILAADNLLMLAVLFPLVKIVHELGHGLVCRYFGAEVHETGVMLLLGYPVPYVDASNSVAFTSKWRRALVAAAGMLAELFVAALAFYAWLLLEPGTARGVAFNIVLLASVTTVVFNANPLLRFDGYYMLMDLIEVPNLSGRANRYWQYLVERFAFGVRGAQPPQSTSGERRWFVLYAPVSYVYRLFISFTIALFVASQFFLIGVIIALWTLGQSVLWPLLKAARALITGPQFAAHTGRVQGVVLAVLALAGVLLFAVPAPRNTVATGVLWLPEQSIVRAQSAGFVRRLIAYSGAQLKPGQPVLEMTDPSLAARIRVQQARADELRVQYDAQWGISQSKALQLEQQLGTELAALARLHDESRRLMLKASAEGTLLLQTPEDLPGRYLRQGDVVGYLRTQGASIVRVVVMQDEVDAVRLDTRSVQIRMAQDTSRIWPAAQVRTTPSAVRQLPSAVLGTKGGGTVAVDPRDDKGLSTLESLFDIELTLPTEVPADFIGSHVTVRFEHSPEPLAWRLGRGIRRLFLSKFST